MTERVKAIGDWRNNAEMIADIAKLGYIYGDVLDPTWGKGTFWKVYRPAGLVGHDINPSKAPDGKSIDFTDLPYLDEQFDCVVFDPPYKLNGTSGGGGPADADRLYGVDGAYVPWQQRHALIRDGMTECARVLRKGGYLVLKCQDQVSSGQVRWQTDEFTEHANKIGLKKVDRLDLRGGRKQKKKRQLHAARNHSTALVFKKVA